RQHGWLDRAGSVCVQRVEAHGVHGWLRVLVERLKRTLLARWLERRHDQTGRNPASVCSQHEDHVLIQSFTQHENGRCGARFFRTEWSRRVSNAETVAGSLAGKAQLSRPR